MAKGTPQSSHERDKKVTICTAASRTIQGKTAIVQRCDWQGGRGDFIAFDNVDKRQEVGSAAILLAGEPAADDELLVELDEPIRTFTSKTDEESVDIDIRDHKRALEEGIDNYKVDLSRHYIARSTGMTADDFWRHGRERLTETSFDRVY